MNRTMLKIKVIVLTIVLSFVFVSGLKAQDKSEYMQAMGAILSEMGATNDNATYLDLTNKFQRIAEKDTSEWLPAYYAAFCTTIYTFGETDKTKVDPLLDKAQTMIDKAFKIKDKESEIWLLQGMLYQARIMVDMMERGMTYSMKASEAFDKAESLNAGNPRIYYLKGQTLFNTPQMYGGGKELAKPMFQKAQEMFLRFKPADAISPNWGKELNELSLKYCE